MNRCLAEAINAEAPIQRARSWPPHESTGLRSGRSCAANFAPGENTPNRSPTPTSGV